MPKFAFPSNNSLASQTRLSAATLLISEGSVRPDYAPFVRDIITHLNAGKNADKMLSFYVIEPENATPTIYIAMSGFGDKNRSRELSNKIADFLKTKNYIYHVEFVPFLIEHKSIIHGPFTEKHADLEAKKDVFSRYLQTLLTASNQVTIDRICTSYHFDQNKLPILEQLRAFMRTDNFKAALDIYNKEFKHKLNSFELLVKEFLYQYLTNIKPEVHATAQFSHIGVCDFNIQAQDWPPIMWDALKVMRKHIYSQFAPADCESTHNTLLELWNDFNANWQALQFSQCAAHCAEDNLLDHFSQHPEILTSPGKQYLFSVKIADHPENDPLAISRPCDVCGVNLPHKFDLVHNLSTGSSFEDKEYLGSMPITYPAPPKPADPQPDATTNRISYVVKTVGAEVEMEFTAYAQHEILLQRLHFVSIQREIERQIAIYLERFKQLPAKDQGLTFKFVKTKFSEKYLREYLQKILNIAEPDLVQTKASMGVYLSKDKIKALQKVNIHAAVDSLNTNLAQPDPAQFNEPENIVKAFRIFVK